MADPSLKNVLCTFTLCKNRIFKWSLNLTFAHERSGNLKNNPNDVLIKIKKNRKIFMVLSWSFNYD